MSDILVLYYSRHGAVRQLAQHIARGIEQVDDLHARLRTVPPVSADHESIGHEVPQAGDPYVEPADLAECVGLALGSPAYFGSIAAPLKYFLDTLTPTWINNDLAGKPAAVFCSSSTQHGGQETTLLSMMVPLLHHGMLITGLPYTEAELHHTRSGGTPYGASHVAGNDNSANLTEDEKHLSQALGKRLAQTARALKQVSK